MHDRIQRVRDRFAMHYFETEIDVRVFRADEWDRVTGFDPTRNHRFGWIPPSDDPDGLIVWLCPEVIVAQTGHLDDMFFAAYLDVIQFTCDLSLAYGAVRDSYERA